jgi:type VI secretion system protein ImpG
LLQEYFNFPEKFLFFDVQNIQSQGLGTELDLYFLFNVDLSDERIVEPDSLLVNCVPVVNLFESVTEPVRLDRKEFEYLLIPDVRQYRAREIHTIKRVVGTDVQGKSTEIAAFMPEHDVYRLEHDQNYWSSRRDFPERMRFPGTETYLSFHDPGFSISLPASESVYAEVTCTNRDLVRSMRIGTELRLVGEGPADRCALVTKPSRYHEPAIRGKQPWELVSHLTLNFSSLGRPAEDSTSTDSGSSRDNVVMVQNLLRMYSEPDNLSHQSLVDSILDLTSQKSVAHTGKDAWRGFTQGMKLTLTVDESRLDQTSIYLFGEIMQRFLALYTTVNSFVTLALFSNQRDEALKIWPPMTGEKALL